MRARIADMGGVLIIFLGSERTEHLATHGVRKSDDSVQRRAHLMAEIGQKVRVETGGLC